MKTAILISFALVLVSQAALAGDCAIITTRYACPGQEAVSYSKCNGVQSCEQHVPATDAADCGTQALKACDNQRLTITQYKTILARFDGQDFAQRDFCNVDSGSYVVVTNFPYRNRPECR